MNSYVASGSLSASGNYQLLAKIRNSLSEVVAILKAPTDLTYTTQAQFDVHRIIETYVGHTIDIDMIVTTVATNNAFGFTVEFGEEYGSPVPAEHYYGVVTGDMFGLNIALSPREYNAYVMNDYLTGGATRQFLNKFKGTRKIFSTTKAFLYFLSAGFQDRYMVAPYDSSGNLIGTISQINCSAGTGAVWYIPSGATNLNLVEQSEIFVGTAGSIIPANTSYYDVWLDQGGLSQASEKIRYSIIENCSKYPNYAIYFLGQYGNMEVWNFNRRSDNNFEIDKQDFKTPLGRFLSQSSYGYLDSDRQLTTYDTVVTNTVTLNSDILTQAELEFLKECVQSPIVYSLEDGVLIPVKITDSFFNQKQKVNDKVFNLTITIQYSSNLELQRA